MLKAKTVATVPKAGKILLTFQRKKCKDIVRNVKLFINLGLKTWQLRKRRQFGLQFKPPQILDDWHKKK